MIMIPLPFVISLIAGFFLVREIIKNRDDDKAVNWFLILFLALTTIQTLLVGTRFGYGYDWLGRIQPFTASLIAPLAFLSFWRPSFKIGFRVLLFSLVVVSVAFIASLYFVDAVLALNNLLFAIALGVLALRGVDALSWVGLGNIRSVFISLWVVVGLLLMSGLTDAVIVWDFWQNSGNNIQKIVGFTFGVGLLLAGTALIVWAMLTRKVYNSQREVNDDVDIKIFRHIEYLMNTEQVFLDPELSLNRIARKLTLPVRDVSRAINSKAGLNVSQYVNGLRVAEACKQLKSSDASILTILYASGFNAKSNFNREFVRVMDSTPSEWRKCNKT